MRGSYPRVQKRCPKCARDVDASNFRRHVDTCRGRQERDIREEWKQFDGSYKCPHCEYVGTKKGIGYHVWRKHTVDGQQQVGTRGHRYVRDRCRYCNSEVAQYTLEKHEKRCSQISRVPKKCLNCETLVVGNSFCSYKCSSQYNARTGKIGGDRVSLQALIRVYGEEEGQKRHLKIVERASNRLQGKESLWKNRIYSEAMRAHSSETCFFKTFRGKSYEEIYGVQKSQEIRDHLSIVNLGMFTLTWFIKKYGELEGQQKYRERSQLISKLNRELGISQLANSVNARGFSKVSQRLFWALYNSLDYLKSKTVYFGELNHEFGCSTNTNFDFVVVEDKKIIEFNGDVFHANPEIYSSNECPHPFCKEATAHELWEKDRIKNQKALDKGYRVFVVWEADFLKSPELILQQCTQFLRE